MSELNITIIVLIVFLLISIYCISRLYTEIQELDKFNNCLLDDLRLEYNRYQRENYRFRNLRNKLVEFINNNINKCTKKQISEKINFLVKNYKK